MTAISSVVLPPVTTAGGLGGLGAPTNVETAVTGLVVAGFPANDFKGQEPGTEAEIKTLNFDANVHDQLGADYAAAVKASARRKKLREAIEVLRSETSE